MTRQLHWSRAARCGALGMLFLLMGCAATPEADNAAALGTPPASVPQAASDAESAPGAVQAEPLPVAFFLAQPEADERLAEVKMADGSLWALQQPVMTRADLRSVEPRRTREGQAFVRFGLTEAAQGRLAELTQRFAGKLLLVAVGDEVIGLLHIVPGQPQALDVGVESDEMALAIANAVLGGPR